MATTTWKDFEKIAGTRVEEDGGKWVRKVKASDVMQRQAYVLFYERAADS